MRARPIGAGFVQPGGKTMPGWGWWTLLVVLLVLIVGGVVVALLRVADQDFEIWWREGDPHPDIAMISTFPDRGLEG